MENQKRKKRFWKKALISVASLFILLAISGITYEAIAGYYGMKKYQPEGKLVNVGDFNLHINKQGNGGPTIILETGSGASSATWLEIPEKLEEFGTVVTYDRGGYGWSEKPTTERTGDNIVHELYTALQKENIEGPYIIVGHSLGGMYARLFAQTYKEEVEGVILLDSRHEDYSQKTDSILLEAGIDPILMGSHNKTVLSLLKGFGIIRLMENQMDVPEHLKNKAVNIEFRSKYFQAKEEELKSMTKVEDSIRNKSLGDIPLTIVTHGIPLDLTFLGLNEEDNQKMEEIWQEQQKQTLELSSNSELIIAENSGHAIYHDEPELVVNVVKNMVEQLKGQ